MTLPPIPPSDNLYKFTAIGGLILAVLSLYVPQQMRTQHILSTIEVNAELEKVNKDRQLLNKDFEEHKNRREALMKMSDELEQWGTVQLKSSPNPSQEVINEIEWIKLFLEERDKRIKFIFGQAESSNRHFEELLERERENHHLLQQFTAEMEKLTYLKPQLDKLYWSSVITFFLGVIMMVVGFWNWYFKFQIYQDRLVKAQAAQWTTPKPERDREEIPE